MLQSQLLEPIQAIYAAQRCLDTQAVEYLQTYADVSCTFTVNNQTVNIPYLLIADLHHMSITSARLSLNIRHTLTRSVCEKMDVEYQVERTLHGGLSEQINAMRSTLHTPTTTTTTTDQN